jgi:hypothetical protein
MFFLQTAIFLKKMVFFYFLLQIADEVAHHLPPYLHCSSTSWKAVADVAQL